MISEIFTWLKAVKIINISFSLEQKLDVSVSSEVKKIK